MKKLIINIIASASLSLCGAFAQQQAAVAAVAAGGEEQITTTTTVTRKVVGAAAVAAPAPASTPEPAVSRADYDAAIATIKRFVADYIHAGESTSESAALELAFYADNVDYFGHGIVDRAFIAKDVREYAARWPERLFQIENNNIVVRSVNANTARAEFVLRYSVRNAKKTIRGAVSNVMLIDFSAGDLKIASIYAKTLYRNEYPALAL